MTKRVLFAELFHETHTFIEGQTLLADFEILKGDEMLQVEGDASPLGGALEVARECGWQVLPAISMRAMPSAIVEDQVLGTWWIHVTNAINAARAGGIDGIYLGLHGAMVCRSTLDVEGGILQVIRNMVGENMPIAGPTDLHANYSPRMAAYSNALITFRENPHTDAKETAMRAARILDRLMNSGEKAQTVFQPTPILWPPSGTATGDEPMRGLESLAREIENKNPDILAVNVHAGYSFADTPDSGLSFSAITIGDTKVAQNELEKLARLAFETKEIGNVMEPPIENVMPRVLEHIAENQTPIVLVEPSDNIGGGAPGDGTGIMRALLSHEIENCAVIINDGAAVEIVSKWQIGARAVVSIGGKGSALDAGPLVLEVELVSTSDGAFELEDLNSHLAGMSGGHIKMGRCAVVRSKGMTILLTTHKTPPFDLGQWRSQGIAPESLAVIGVKAAVAHRRAYDPICRASFSVSTPGPCVGDLRLLPFRHLRRPIFPLDDL